MQHWAVECWGDWVRLHFASFTHLGLFLLFFLEAKHFSSLFLFSARSAGPFPSELFPYAKYLKLSEKASILYPSDMDSSTPLIKKESQSTKQKSKQNITRDIEIKNKWTVTSGKRGGDNGGGRVKGFQEQL